MSGKLQWLIEKLRWLSLKRLWCTIVGHDFQCHGYWNDYTDYGPEYDEQWECGRCGWAPSSVCDEEKLTGRIQSLFSDE